MPIYERETHFRETSPVDEAGVQTKQHNVPLYRGTQIVWYLFYIVETVLLFRFVLKLIGANAAAPFTTFVYGISYPFAAPFLNVVRSVRASGSVFEWSTLLAMLVWWLVAIGIVKLLSMSRPVSTTEAHRKLEEQESHTG